MVASASIDGATGGPAAGPGAPPPTGPGTDGDLTPAGTFILPVYGGFGFGGGWGGGWGYGGGPYGGRPWY